VATKQKLEVIKRNKPANQRAKVAKTSSKEQSATVLSILNQNKHVRFLLKRAHDTQQSTLSFLEGELGSS